MDERSGHHGSDDVPAPVRNRALAAGLGDWLAALPALVVELSARWELTLGEPFDDGTEGYVVAAQRSDGRAGVLKVVVPADPDLVRREIEVLRLAGGSGCAELLADDVERCALLTERLGRPLYRLGLPLPDEHRVMCAAASALWRAVPTGTFPTGADKAAWLAHHIPRRWEELGRPCTERAVEHAVSCAERRGAVHDDERAVLVHGDVQQWNTLESDGGFKLIDPDGFAAEPEFDLGVMLREDPVSHAAMADPFDRARFLAGLCGLDPVAVWEWGAAERVSTGLLATKIDLQPVGRQMLAAADRFARDLSGP